MTIRSVLPEDAAQICEIYNHYVTDSVATFEEDPVSQEEMSRRIAEITATLPWLVTESRGDVDGYAYASRWKTRTSYRFCVESTIYLKPGLGGRGVGHELYAELMAELRRGGLHSVISGIALPNAASIALHEKLGFRKIGHFEQVGWKLGKWVDVGYWELLL